VVHEPFLVSLVHFIISFINAQQSQLQVSLIVRIVGNQFLQSFYFLYRFLLLFLLLLFLLSRPVLFLPSLHFLLYVLSAFHREKLQHSPLKLQVDSWVLLEIWILSQQIHLIITTVLNKFFGLSCLLKFQKTASFGKSSLLVDDDFGEL
jgi:hypothetical protein